LVTAGTVGDDEQRWQRVDNLSRTQPTQCVDEADTIRCDLLVSSGSTYQFADRVVNDHERVQLLQDAVNGSAAQRVQAERLLKVPKVYFCAPPDAEHLCDHGRWIADRI
jgi:hypothetical protein